MVAMQYKIHLPSDYDMQIIRKRVADNGNKTDGFQGLHFKCYLIQEKSVDGFENTYAPLYLWKDSAGMNQFLFSGYYDNIIKSFGWQKVHIGVPLFLDLKDDFAESKYVSEEKKSITPQISLTGFEDSIAEPSQRDYIGRVCIYNPDEWNYSQFYFYKTRPEGVGNQNCYQILHISQGE